MWVDESWEVGCMDDEVVWALDGGLSGYKRGWG